MCSFSNYLESSILNHVFSKADYSLQKIFVGLLTDAPDDDGSSVSEPDFPSYRRAETNESNWDTAFEGAVENTCNVTFPMACENWGKVTHFALFDAASGGNVLAYGSLGPSKTLNSGDIPRFAAGDLIISLD